jgi:hypothetical protein
MKIASLVTLLSPFGGRSEEVPLPDAPTCSVVNNGDGTITATIAGSIAGASNIVVYAPKTGFPVTTWTYGGKRTGDGDVTFAITGDAWYWFDVRSTSS